jgi:hypothetical protein
VTFALLVFCFAADFQIEVGVAKGLLDKPTDGRVLVVLGNPLEANPVRTIGDTRITAAPVIGGDATALQPGKPAVLTKASLTFPVGTLARVKAGKYRVQALFDHSLNIRLPRAPGNLLSEPVLVDIDPVKGGTLRLELTKAIPEPVLPNRPEIKWIHLRSQKLSTFWGRDITLRAGLLLPAGWEKERERKYPLRVHIGGFGSRYTAISRMRPAGPTEPAFLTLMLDGAGPLGDPYQVNSANHGPWGDAITQELIPHVEKEYRGNGKRVTDGASTGGWVSLALQVFYPDYFSGCWSHCPDPVDFRDFQLMNLYRDTNAYVNPHGFERSSRRDVNGDTIVTVRQEVLLERVLGRGDRWELSGRDWASWNATFGPRGKDGTPVPLWQGESGTINREVLDHWKRYDLRMHLETNWKTLAPKLRGKIHVFVGDADDFFLNNAVERLNQFFERAEPKYEGRIEFARRKGHSWQALTQRQLLAEMARAVGGEASAK